MKNKKKKYPIQLIINNKLEIKRAIHAEDMLWVLWEHKQILRGMAKYGSLDSFEDIYKNFCEMLNDSGFDLDKLYS